MYNQTFINFGENLKLLLIFEVIVKKIHINYKIYLKNPIFFTIYL